VFVRGGMPGDRVSARVGKSKRAYAEADVVHLLEPGPDRIEPLADHPGAPWQVLRYERQLQTKQEQVDDALKRIGKLKDYQLDPIIPAVEQWRYRNKLEYSFGTDADGRLVCGFHAPGRWDEIVETRDCLLASEAGNEARERVVAFCREQRLTVYDRRAGTGMLRNLVVREGRRTGQLQVRLVTSPGELDREALIASVATPETSVLWSQTDSPAETTQGGDTELLSGDDRLTEEIGDLTVRISPDAFFQTNTEMAEQLYALATEYASLKGFERLYDLYCGIGTIGLSLAPRAAELFGLEIIEEAVGDAIENARQNEIENAKFFAGDVRLALRELIATAGKPHVIVVDPPRAGL
jgi:23S rRNA (uracil1939-C5)-methyltransferase